MFRVGLVGCGGIAQVHAAVLHALPDTELVACADIRPERAESLANRYACRPYPSMEAMLDGESLDALHLCTPHDLHTPMVVAASERGLPVLTEKPPVISADQWAALQQAGERIPIGVCFQNRYNRNVQETRKIIRSGEYGEVVGGRAFVTWSRGADYYTSSDWRGSWAREGGGALINQSIHTLDLLVWLMGHPTSVEARMANHHLAHVIEVEDTVEACLTLGNKPALFYASTAYAGNAPVLIEIQLEKAAIRLEDNTLEIRSTAGVERRAFQSEEPLGKGYWGNGHLPCIADFYARLSQGLPPRINLADIQDTVSVMLQMYEQGKKDLLG